MIIILAVYKQKSQKVDIIQQHTETQSVWCGQYHLLWFLLLRCMSSLILPSTSV